MEMTGKNGKAVNATLKGSNSNKKETKIKKITQTRQTAQTGQY